jgi:hypothetical protein
MKTERKYFVKCLDTGSPFRYPDMIIKAVIGTSTGAVAGPRESEASTATSLDRAARKTTQERTTERRRSGY